ncbi:hypothetical protein S245_024433, partial [Arachis hypogaea]
IVVILKLIQQSQRLVPDEIQLSQVLDFSLHPQELKSVSYNTIYHSIRKQCRWSSPDLLPLQKKKYKRERKSQSLGSKIPSEDAKFHR